MHRLEDTQGIYKFEQFLEHIYDYTTNWYFEDYIRYILNNDHTNGLNVNPEFNQKLLDFYVTYLKAKVFSTDSETDHADTLQDLGFDPLPDTLEELNSTYSQYNATEILLQMMYKVHEAKD